jgi:hypothetical protein
LRLNSPFDPVSQITFVEIFNASAAPLKVVTYIGDKYGRLNLNISGTQSVPYANKQKQLAYLIDGVQSSNIINVRIIPADPDFSKTVMIPENVTVLSSSHPMGTVKF